jgi:hypothetical protein
MLAFRQCRSPIASHSNGYSNRACHRLIALEAVNIARNTYGHCPRCGRSSCRVITGGEVAIHRGRAGNQISIGDCCRPPANAPLSICPAYDMTTTTSKGIMEKVSSLIREIENLVINPTKDALKVRRINPAVEPTCLFYEPSLVEATDSVIVLP